MKTKVLLVMLFVVGLSISVRADELVDVYVNTVAAGNNDGTSWADAFTDLQSALPGNGKRIHVAAGRYSPGPNATDTFTVGDEITMGDAGDTVLLGGYNPDNPGGFPRNPWVYRTVLDGDVNQDDVIYDLHKDPLGPYNAAQTGTRMDNNTQVVCAWGAGWDLYPRRGALYTATLDGFVIANGGGNDMATENANGPAVRALNYHVVVKNCVVMRHHCRRGAISPGRGCTLVVDNCLFESNAVYTSAAAIHFNNKLDDKWVPWPMTITNCVFRGNLCYAGGLQDTGGFGIVQCDGSFDATIENCVFDNNLSYGEETGVALMFTGKYESNATVNNCVFIANESVAKATVAIDNDSGKTDGYSLSVKLANCLLRNNLAKAEYGGAHDGGAIHILNNDDPEPLTVEVVSCTIANNQDNLAVPGIAVTSDLGLNPDVMTLKNTIVWGNAGLTGNGQFNWDTANGGTLSMNYNCIGDPGDSNTYIDPAGTGNISDDPQFADADCHLASGSPCIDAGDPTDSVGSEPKCNGGIINMGVYGGTVNATPTEDGVGTKEADIDCDGDVDMGDFAKLAAQWMS